MPTTRFQRFVFALLTVAITVHVFVFYNLAIAMGGMSNAVFAAAWRIVPIEFACALALELLVGSPLSAKLAFRVVDPRTDKPFLVETAIICATVGIMCPLMSLAATVIYDGFGAEFLAQWLQKIVINFPMAFFSQLFFIQPLVRTLFRALFRRQLSHAKSGTATGCAAA